MFINTMGFGIVVPLLPFYGQSFHAAPWQIALIFSAYSVGSFFGEPFWGRLSDRIGRKPILISTLLANCACYGALAFAPNIYAAFLIRLVGGMAAGNNSVVQGYIADVTPQDERAGQMSKLGAAYNIGFILGPVHRRDAGQALGGPSGLPDPAAGRLGVLGLLGAGRAPVRAGKPRRAPSRGPQKSRWAMIGYAARHPVIGRVIAAHLPRRLRLHRDRVAPSASGRSTGSIGSPRNVSWCFGIAGLVSAPTQFFLTGPALAAVRRGADAGGRAWPAWRSPSPCSRSATAASRPSP